jgi:hypothetical protein
MDIDHYHAAGWLLALGMTAFGIFRRRDRRLLPLFVIAGFIIFVGAGQHAGLAIVEPRWQEARYMQGFIILAIGLAIWSAAYLFTKDDA